MIRWRERDEERNRKERVKESKLEDQAYVLVQAGSSPVRSTTDQGDRPPKGGDLQVTPSTSPLAGLTTSPLSISGALRRHFVKENLCTGTASNYKFS